MINEAVAMEKLCPIVSDGNDSSVLCTGSHCMAWRWAFNQQNRGFCVLLSTQITIRERIKNAEDGEI